MEGSSFESDSRHRLTLWSFLFPTRLLNETGGWDNPFLLRFKYRRRRVMRVLLTIVFMGLLITLTSALLLGFGFVSVVKPVLSGNSLGVSLPFRADGMEFIAIVLWVFVQLRLNLLIHDRSGVQKALSPANLPELYLAPLGNNTIFLHLFCQFCRRFELLIVYTACVLGVVAFRVFTERVEWIDPSHWNMLIYFAFAVLCVWALSVFQYIWEWRSCTGSARAIVHEFISICLSFGICLIFGAILTMFLPGITRISEYETIFFTFTIGSFVFICLVLCVYFYGRDTHESAREILFRELFSEDPDHVSMAWKRISITQLFASLTIVGDFSGNHKSLMQAEGVKSEKNRRIHTLSLMPVFGFLAVAILMQVFGHANLMFPTPDLKWHNMVAFLATFLFLLVSGVMNARWILPQDTVFKSWLAMLHVARKMGLVGLIIAFLFVVQNWKLRMTEMDFTSIPLSFLGDLFLFFSFNTLFVLMKFLIVIPLLLVMYYQLSRLGGVNVVIGVLISFLTGGVLILYDFVNPALAVQLNEYFSGRTRYDLFSGLFWLLVANIPVLIAFLYFSFLLPRVLKKRFTNEMEGVS